MPKMKTNSGALKRFKRAANGRYKFRRSGRNHINAKMTTKRKRHLRPLSLIAKADQLSVARMLNDK